MRSLIEEIKSIVNGDTGEEEELKDNGWGDVSEGIEGGGESPEMDAGGTSDPVVEEVAEDEEKARRLSEIAQMKGIISGDICEAKGIDAMARAKIKRMTQNNEHGAALEYGAKVMGAKLLEKKFALINKLHDLDGHLDRDLGKYRDNAMDDLFKLAKQDLSSEDYDVFHGAF